jgi:hypothetical protein
MEFNLLKITKTNQIKDLGLLKSSFVKNVNPFKNIIYDVFNDFTRRSPNK